MDDVVGEGSINLLKRIDLPFIWPRSCSVTTGAARMTIAEMRWPFK
jgi:hypothetical protein